MGDLTSASTASVSRVPALRDALLVALATLTAAVVSVHYEVSEAVLDLTRLAERYQLDEIPGVLLVLALGLAWFSARRYREACDELRKRADAERALARALKDGQAIAQQHARMWDAERKRLACELHDELGQYINAIKIDAVEIRNSSRDRAPRIEQPANAIIDATNHLHSVVADMMRRLRPVGLDDLGLVAALEHCVATWRERLKTTAFHVHIDPELHDLGDTLDLTIYRLAQEGLTNICKHAHAKRVDIDLTRERGQVLFSLSDDGQGSNGPRAAGLGLIGMRDRVQSLGGSFTVRTNPGQGFHIVARLPFQTMKENARGLSSHCLAR